MGLQIFLYQGFAALLLCTSTSGKVSRMERGGRGGGGGKGVVESE